MKSGAWQRLGRTLSILSFTLLVILLPALVAEARIREPAQPEEIARIRTVLARTPAEGASPGSIPARFFFRATLPFVTRDLGVSGLEDPAQRVNMVTYARFVGLLCLLLLSCSLYLVLAAARSRTTALLGCLALAILPPVAHEGYVLRPETPAAGCGTLALAVLLAALVLERPLRQMTELRRFSVMTALFLGSGALCGLSAAFLPSAGALVLLPSAMLILVTASLTLVMPRYLRRRPDLAMPLRAMSLRLLPWLLAMLLWLWLCAVLILFGYEAGTGVQRASKSEVGLLPRNLLLSAPLVLLATMGALRWIWSAGQKISRGARLGAETVLVVYAGLLLVQMWWSEPGSDALIAAVPFAMLIAEGLSGLLPQVVRSLRR